MSLRVWRAAENERAAAYGIVQEYNEAVGVQQRDSPESFARDYFAPGAGLWLAATGADVVGCIALRRLRTVPQAGEVKRLYVRPSSRGQGAAEALLSALEGYAADAGYQWLYLDSKADLVVALHFYRSRGYTPCERYNDNPQATVFLRKPIGTAAQASASPEPAATR